MSEPKKKKEKSKSLLYDSSLLSLLLPYCAGARDPSRYYVYLMRLALLDTSLYRLLNSDDWWKSLNLSGAAFDEPTLLAIILPRRRAVQSLFLYKTKITNPLTFIVHCPNLLYLDISDCNFMKKTGGSLSSPKIKVETIFPEKGSGKIVETLRNTAVSIDNGIKAMAPVWLPIEWEGQLPIMKKMVNSKVNTLVMLRTTLYQDQLDILLKFTPNLLDLHIGGSVPFNCGRVSRYIGGLRLLDVSQYQSPNPSAVEELKNLEVLICNVPSLLSKAIPSHVQIHQSLPGLLESLFGTKPLSKGQTTQILNQAMELIDIGAEQCVLAVSGKTTLLYNVLSTPTIPINFIHYYIQGGKSNSSYWKQRKLLDFCVSTDSPYPKTILLELLTNEKPESKYNTIKNPQEFFQQRLCLLMGYEVNINSVFLEITEDYFMGQGPLSFAFEKGFWEVVKYMILHGNWESPQLEAGLLFLKAVQMNTWTLKKHLTVRSMMSYWRLAGYKINFSSEYLAFFVRRAIEANASIQFFEYLFSHEFNRNVLVTDVDRSHRHTLLHYAATLKPDCAPTIVEMLIKLNANPNFHAPLDEPPIFSLVGPPSPGGRELDILTKFFESSSVDLSIRNSLGRSIISESIHNGNVYMANFFIQKKLHYLIETESIYVDILATSKMHPEDQIQLIRQIHASGFKITHPISFLDLLRHFKSRELVDYLIQLKIARPPPTGIENLNEILELMETRSSGWIQTLDKGIQIHNKQIVNSEGDSILHWTCKYSVKAQEIKKILAFSEKSIHEKNMNQHTPLIVACKFGNLEAVNILLKKYVEDLDLFFNERDELGDYPLHIAVRMGYLRLVELLLNSYHPIGKKNLEGKTPIDLCSQSPKIMLLLSHRKSTENTLATYSFDDDQQ